MFFFFYSKHSMSWCAILNKKKSIKIGANQVKLQNTLFVEHVEISSTIQVTVKILPTKITIPAYSNSHGYFLLTNISKLNAGKLGLLLNIAIISIFIHGKFCFIIIHKSFQYTRQVNSGKFILVKMNLNPFTGLCS